MTLSNMLMEHMLTISDSHSSPSLPLDHEYRISTSYALTRHDEIKNTQGEVTWRGTWWSGVGLIGFAQPLCTC